MSEQAFAILVAGSFTFGCAAIYEMRSHAREMSGVVLRVALCLAPVIALLAVTGHGVGDHGKTDPNTAQQSPR